MTSMLTPNLSEQSLGATSSSSRSDHGHSSPASEESKASASSADMDEEVADRQGITAGISKTSRSSNPQRQQPTKRSTSGILKTPLIRNAIPSFHSLNSQDALTNEKDLERITSENTLTNSRTRLTVPQLHNRTAGNLSSVPERQLWDTQVGQTQPNAITVNVRMFNKRIMDSVHRHRISWSIAFLRVFHVASEIFKHSKACLR